MNVVNFGSLNIDHVYAVDHFCRAGETIHTKSYTQNAGGKGLNQSIAVSRSGQKVHHAGLLGPEGTRLAELLSGSGVDLRYLKHTDVPQGHAVIQVQPDGQNCIFLYGGSNQAVTPQEIDEVLMQLNAGDYLLLQNEIANLTYLLRAAARRGLRVVLNASPISDELLNADLSGVDWLVVNEIECAAMAGCGAHSRIEGFGFLPVTCFTMALTTFVSQNLGAKAYDRVKKGIRVGIFCSVTIAETVALLIFIFSPKLIGLFTGDAESIAFGVMHQRTTTPFFFLLAYSHCMAAIFRGAGKSTVPMLVMMLCWCIIRVIYVTVAVKFFPVLQTVSWAYPITWGLSTLVFTLYYFKADWMHAFERREKHA